MTLNMSICIINFLSSKLCVLNEQDLHFIEYKIIDNDVNELCLKLVPFPDIVSLATGLASCQNNTHECVLTATCT